MKNKQQSNVMIEDIFARIRQLSEELDSNQRKSVQVFVPRNYKNILMIPNDQTQKIPQSILKQYLRALECIGQHIFGLLQMRTEYLRLQQYLQKQETQIRKHFGIEQEMKIYSDIVKLQLQQCQRQKHALLQSSTRTIKQLKTRNQFLFHQVHELRQRLSKTSIKKTFSSKQKSRNKDSDRDSSLKKILKTQYIQRQKPGVFGQGKRLKFSKVESVKKHNGEEEQRKKHRLNLLQKCREKTKPHGPFDLAAFLQRKERKSAGKPTELQQKPPRAAKRRQKQAKQSLVGDSRSKESRPRLTQGKRRQHNKSAGWAHDPVGK